MKNNHVCKLYSHYQSNENNQITFEIINQSKKLINIPLCQCEWSYLIDHFRCICNHVLHFFLDMRHTDILEDPLSQELSKNYTPPRVLMGTWGSGYNPKTQRKRFGARPSRFKGPESEKPLKNSCF